MSLPKQRSRRPDYGLDAPPVVYSYATLGIVGLALIVAAAVFPGLGMVLGWGIWALVLGLVVAGAMFYSSKHGKLQMRDRLLDGLDLHGDEDVLDLGCGSGLLLLGVAQRLTTGTATGIDLWRSRDQAGSNRDRCLDNARRLGLTKRISLVDADMTDLPFSDASFDLVLASLAIHNLHPRGRRGLAIREATRVLCPGGRLAIIDMFGTKAYTEAAHAAGLRNVHRSGYLAGIFPPARAVTADMPVAGASRT